MGAGETVLEPPGAKEEPKGKVGVERPTKIGDGLGGNLPQICY